MVTIGIDEVGRGCWAGPLVAAAVVLSHPITGLKDSKKLSKQQRDSLNKIIQKRALAIGLGWAQAAEIDNLGLTAAVRLAMQRALAQITLEYHEIIIDGNYNFINNNLKARAVIKADNSVPAVSAASIVAKVARDAYMAEAAANYPEYGFDKHVGYGTALHREKLKLHGVCELHRHSFQPIRALLQLAA